MFNITFIYFIFMINYLLLHLLHISYNRFKFAYNINYFKIFLWGRKKMKSKMIGILVVTLLIATAFPALGLVEKSEISCLKIEDSGVITTNILDVLDQQQTTYTGEERIQQLNSGGLAQSFIPALTPLTKISVLWIKSSGTPEFAYYTIEIRSDIHSTSYLRKITIDYSQIQTGLYWYNWDFSDLSVTVGNTYWIVCYATTATIFSTQVKWCYGSPGDPYPNGMPMINYGPPLYWSAYDLWGDFCFKTYGIGGTDNPPVVVIETPTDGFTTSNPVLTVEGYVTDDIGIASFGRKHEWTGDMRITSGTLPPPYPTYYAFSEVFDLELGWNRITIFVSDSSGQPGEDQIEVYYVLNQAPLKPSTPTGPSSGKAGNSYIYGTSTTDPDGDQVYYQWDWGHEISPWDGPYNSGDPVTVSHIFPSQGSYSVKVKAKDTNSDESVFSDPLSVSMPKNKPYLNRPILNFLQQHPYLFPILRQLLLKL